MALSPASSHPAASPVSVATATLTDAQIKALPTTPVLIVPAQGAGTMILPLCALFSSHFTAGAYTNLDVWSQTNVFAGTLYLAWDALNFFNDATGPIAGIAFLDAAEARVALAGPSSGAITQTMLNNNLTNSGYDVGSGVATANGYGGSTLSVVGQNAGGNFTGGNVANTLVVTVLYAVVSL